MPMDGFRGSQCHHGYLKLLASILLPSMQAKVYEDCLIYTDLTQGGKSLSFQNLQSVSDLLAVSEYVPNASATRTMLCVIQHLRFP